MIFSSSKNLFSTTFLFLCGFMLLFSFNSQAQFQFEQVMPSPPAPLNMADFTAVSDGNMASTDVDDIYSLVANTPFTGVAEGSIAFADIDSDGDQDVLITGAGILSNQRISELYTNDGFGNFSLVANTPFTGVQQSSIAFADIDGDNDQDVLITGNRYNPYKPISELYTNDGSGNYSLVINTPFTGVQQSSIAFADIDGDGDQDVLITGYKINPSPSDRISELYINNGLGNFSLVSNTPFNDIAYGSIAFADIDGDSDQDVLLTGSINNNGVYVSTLYANDGSGNFSLVANTPFRAVTYSSIAFADVDGDTDQDVLITGVSNSIPYGVAELYINDGSGNYSVANNTPFAFVDQGSIAFADIDGDFDQDVLITGFGGMYRSDLYTNDGSGSFSLVTNTPFINVYRSSIAFADVDGDGDPDVLITGDNVSPHISNLYRNNSSCNITASCQPFTLTLDSTGSATIQPADIDNGSTVTCGTPTLSISKSVFTCADVGEQTVTLYVTDGNNNVDSCTAIVNVSNLALTCADGGERFVTSAESYEVNGTEFDLQSASNNCSSNLTVTHNAQSLFGDQSLSDSTLAGWSIPMGVNTITFTASAGTNSSTCTVNIEVKELSISGNLEVGSNCNPVPIRVELYEAGTPNGNPILVQSHIVQMDMNGDFTANLPNLAPGTYGVYIKADTYLQEFLGDILIDGAVTNISLSNLAHGDVAGGTFGDNLISTEDLSFLVTVYNTQIGDANYNERADINCDGGINILDVSILLIQYLSIGAEPSN